MDLSCSKMKQALAEKERLLSLKEERPTALLEREWARYKYLILAKNPNGYKEIRVLLKNKSAFPVEAFYGIVKKSLPMPENKGYEINAAQHVFGYFKKRASPEEKKLILSLIGKYQNGTAPLSELKGGLYRLSVKYSIGYLLDSYYFCDI